MKRALIIGSRGQDGQFLCRHLEQLGYCVTGIVRPSAPFGCSGQHLPVDVGDAGAVGELLRRLRPDEIYYLAAYHQASESAPVQNGPDLFLLSLRVHVLSLVNVLEAMKTFLRDHGFFTRRPPASSDAPTMSRRTSRLPLPLYAFTASPRPPAFTPAGITGPATVSSSPPGSCITTNQFFVHRPSFPGRSPSQPSPS